MNFPFFRKNRVQK